MNTKHTPGPWTRENAMSSDFDNFKHITGPDCEQVATVHQMEPQCNVSEEPRMTQAEAAANAKLIAAAPDLLAALKEVMEYIELCCEDWELPEGAYAMLTGEAMQDANLAIAAATS